LDPNAWIGPAIVAATIAALINVLGWVVAGRRELNGDRRRRREREIDVQTALKAEIEHYLDALRLFDPDQTWDRVVSEMEADSDHIPAIPSERNDTVFTALVDEIHILPEPVIQPVVRYYNQIFAIDAIIADMRDAQFQRMTQPQRIAMYTDYIALKKEALVQGLAAVTSLSDSLSGAVNTPGAARSGRR
jgi:hypothetical protein